MERYTVVHILQVQTNIHLLPAATIFISYHPPHLAKNHPITHPFYLEFRIQCGATIHPPSPFVPAKALCGKNVLPQLI